MPARRVSLSLAPPQPKSGLRFVRSGPAPLQVLETMNAWFPSSNVNETILVGHLSSLHHTPIRPFLNSRRFFSEHREKPNVLLLIADDLNDFVGPDAGHPQTKTPNLDKLAARGVTFRNAMCAAPLCNPSRTAFLSGMRPSTTGIYDNEQVWMPHIGRGLCLNDYVRKFGYTSLGSGKIYHYRNYRAEDWDKVVFYADDTLPNHEAERSPGPFGYRMFTEDKPQKPFEEQRAESKLVDAQSVTWCIDRLAEQKGPFFMVCGVHRPHTPWDVPKKYFDMHPLDSIQLPPVLTNDLADVPPAGQAMARTGPVYQNIIKLGLWKDRVRAYLAAISYADAQLGRLLMPSKNPASATTPSLFSSAITAGTSARKSTGAKSRSGMNPPASPALGRPRPYQSRRSNASKQWIS